LREVGALRGIVCTDGTSAEQLIAEARALPTMAGQDLAGRVTTARTYHWTKSSIDLAMPIAAAAAAGAGPAGGASSANGGHAHASRKDAAAARASALPKAESATTEGSLVGRTFRSDKSDSQREGASAPEVPSLKVVAYDFGIKRNILRLLVDHGCDVTVVPATTSADDILAMKPHGVFLSNGPGDPEPITYAVANIRKLVGRVPIFGICLGHQLCGLALGGKTFKLKFGHHGSNHPVKNLLTQKVEITSQNHGFCVDPDSLPSSDVEITHVNLNDHTNEGMRHRSLPLFSVQYHPEASPGPHDARYLFDDFIRMMSATWS
jgi:carbamoyl-phosphate synthase small subunit